MRQAAGIANELGGMSGAVSNYASDTALSEQFLDLAGERASNWHLVHNGTEGNGGSALWEEFASRFKKQFGTEPGQFAGNAFDLASLVITSVKGGAGRDRAAVVAGVLRTAPYSGVTGSVHFNSSGDPVSWQMTGYRIENSAFVFESTLNSP